MTLDELKQIDRVISFVIHTAKTDAHWKNAMNARYSVEREIKLKLMERTPTTTVIELKRGAGGDLINV